MWKLQRDSTVCLTKFYHRKSLIMSFTWLRFSMNLLFSQLTADWTVMDWSDSGWNYHTASRSSKKGKFLSSQCSQKNHRRKPFRRNRRLSRKILVFGSWTSPTKPKLHSKSDYQDHHRGNPEHEAQEASTMSSELSTMTSVVSYNFILQFSTCSHVRT